MPRFLPPLVVALAVLLSALCAEASPDSASRIGIISVPRASMIPRLDGTFNSPAWKNASTARLDYNLRDHGAATQSTTVYTMTAGAFLYVGVEAKQTIPIRATEHTNGVGLDTDDEFQIDLWPNGTAGFRYKFTSTAIGTHYQYSTENNSYEPVWWSAGKIIPGGYVVTMKIPLAVMHGTGSGEWRVQFIRYISVTNDVFVWSFGPAQQDFNDVNYSGSLAGLPRLSALRARPRVGVYGLAQAASSHIGGSTSRAGADLSIPLLPGTALVGTIHPDYSNVETDQQTIAPTAFKRIFNEVRPFFTQGANFYSYPNGICSGCPGVIEFYTPNIPTPRDGYAIEGQRGLFSYAALNTVSATRDDVGEAVNYVSPNQQTALDFQGSSVNMPLLHDDAGGITFTHSNLKNFLQFARYSDDSGSNVKDAGESQRYEAGAGIFQPDGSNFNAVIRKVGAYFNPVDGLVQHPDIAGYDLNLFKAFKYPTTDRFNEFDVTGNLDRYHDHTGLLDQSESNVSFSVTTRTLFNVRWSTGSSYVRLAPNDFSPTTQQGARFGYDLNSSFPTFVAFNSGRFGPGRLNAWTRSTTFREGLRGAVTLEADDTDQGADSGARYAQWLERFSYAYQPGSDESMAFGIRRIIGSPPELFGVRPVQSGWNLSAAFHQKVPGGEIYVVYGDAAEFSTVPRFIVKYIRYIGADKGT